MACVEHWCNNADCNYVAITNNPEITTVCPQCGGTDMGKAFDEDGDHDYRDDDYDSELEDEDDYDTDMEDEDFDDDYQIGNC